MNYKSLTNLMMYNMRIEKCKNHKYTAQWIFTDERNCITAVQI